MNQIQDLKQQDGSLAREIGLVDILIVLAKHKKSILGVTFGAALLSVAASLIMPNVYQATTKLLPPQQGQSSAAALLSQLGGMAGVAGAAGLKSPNELYVGMLKSRTVADRLVAQFDLKKAYGKELQGAARAQLEINTTISSGKDGLITIEVEDKDPKRVAPLTNAYVDELFRLTKVLAVTEAAQRRVFYERQLETTKNNLSKAEISLKSTLNSRGVISVDAESRTIVETVSRLRAQVSAKEIQLSSMRAFVTSANPEYRRVEEELSGMRAELSRLENGRGGAATGGESRGGLENVGALRDLKYQQFLYELLAKQYEAARMDEAKEPSLIQVLDPAMEPERKSKPKRALIVLLATAIAAVGAITWAFLTEARRNALSSQQGAAQWAELKTHLRFRKGR